MRNSKVFDIRERSFQFSVKIVKFILQLPKNTSGIAIGNQVIRSGTSIGANIEEAQNSSSKKEFIRGMTIALKEARETLYWLKLITETGLVSNNELVELLEENEELVKILTVIVKNSKV